MWLKSQHGHHKVRKKVKKEVRKKSIYIAHRRETSNAHRKLARSSRLMVICRKVTKHRRKTDWTG